MQIDKTSALETLNREALLAESESPDPIWDARLSAFSQMCQGVALTHIPFIGTALLAKSVDDRVDVYSVKSKDDSEGAYSARGLAHGVLVPNAPRLGINLGVTGREPLNNQPYFGISGITPDASIRGSVRGIWLEVCALIEAIANLPNTTEARKVLRAFIRVRRGYVHAYGNLGTTRGGISSIQFVQILKDFVSANSESGKRAQAVVAGLMDVFFGSDRVLTTKIHDPDRNVPGDVAIIGPDGIGFDGCFEVRDKPVNESDLYHFIEKSALHSVSKAAVVAVGRGQREFLFPGAIEFGHARGVSISVFFGWPSFVNCALFFYVRPSAEFIEAAPAAIFNRLQEMEVSSAGVDAWIESLSLSAA